MLRWCPVSRLLVLPCLLALLVSCESSPSDPETASLHLRLANDTGAPISVEVVATERVPTDERINVDFGTIDPQQVSTYREVSPEFVVLVDGVLFPGGDFPFGISDPPSAHWTFRIQEGGAWSQTADFD